MASVLINFSEPIFVFTLILIVIFVGPLLFRFIRVPDVAGYIIAGILIGPYGFKLIERDSGIELLGSIGLLYIMFLAGLELDPVKLKESRKNSILFGSFTFTIPFSLGIVVSIFFLKLPFISSVLVSIMFSTHTLVAYPIARRLGIVRDTAVLTAIGGTIITDTIVLLILSLISGSSPNNLLIKDFIILLLKFSVYLILVFFSYPRIARWFFKHIKRDRIVHYLFLITMVCISSVIAELIGIEAIIGAFTAGLALNRSIPKNSLLMHHIDFVGNLLFIPVFLIGIGMMINTGILFSGTELWYISFVLIISALVGKWIAALITQVILRFSVLQRNVLFGLTSSHAAATLAVILIGFEKQMISENIFNATILIILISSIIASFVTEKYGKRLAIINAQEPEEVLKRSERILVPVSNPSTMANLVSLAYSFNSINPTESVYILSVVNDDKSVKNNLKNVRECLETNVAEYNHLSENIKVLTRIDLNVSSGILRTAKEYMIHHILFGWGEKTTTSQKIFGNIFDHLLTGEQTLFVCNFNQPIDNIEKIITIMPKDIEYEPSFSSIMDKLSVVPLKGDGLRIIYQHKGQVVQNFRKADSKKSRLNMQFKFYQQLSEIDIPEEDHLLIVLFFLRQQSVAYNALHNSVVRKIVTEHKTGNILIVVPGFDENE